MHCRLLRSLLFLFSIVYTDLDLGRALDGLFEGARHDDDGPVRRWRQGMTTHKSAPTAGTVAGGIKALSYGGVTPRCDEGRQTGWIAVVAFVVRIVVG